MLPIDLHEADGPLLVTLHWLGGNASSWAEVSEGCSVRGLACAALDLPGFGRAAEAAGVEVETLTVGASVDAAVATIQSIRSTDRRPWLLAGHSMGGKFAAIIARAALDGTPGLEDLRGLVLVSPSPPGPEPMDESVRRENIESLGHSTRDAEEDRKRAGAFVDANTGKLPLLEYVRTRSIDGVLQMNRSAFVDWFTTGSLEDWGLRVGTIPLPTLILAGTTELKLGPEAQAEHSLPHFPEATLVSLEGAGHLSPLERPAELAERVVAFVRDLGLPMRRVGADLNPEFQGLINSRLTSPQTRDVLNRRLADDQLAGAGVLDSEEMLTLRAVAARIVPGFPFDLAVRVDRWLALPSHDGWRHDSLPADAEACKTGLRSFVASSRRRYGVPFSALDAGRQDGLLALARDGNLGKGLLDALHPDGPEAVFTASQMRDWFGDLRAELLRIYVADPRTMHRMGFTGFADEAGFTQIRLNEREGFEI